MTPYGMEYPSGQFGSVVPDLFPPSSFCPPRPSLAGQYGKLKCPWLCVSSAQQQLKHQCAISIALIQNPEHSTTPGARKKINFIPAGNRTSAF